MYEIGQRNRGFIPETRITTLKPGDRSQGGKTNQAPVAYQPTLTTPAIQNQISTDSIVCVFKDLDPWGVTDTEDILATNNIPYNVYTSAEFGSLDFNQCQMIVFSGDQPKSFYDAYAMHLNKFENYVTNGGFLNFFSADTGWNGGFLWAPLPGGMIWNLTFAETNEVVDPDHPVMRGVPNPFSGYYASQGGFTNLPEDAHIIAIDTSSGLPTIVEYPIGAGWLIAFGQPLETSHYWGWDAGLILENTLIWGHEYHLSDVSWLDTYPTSGTLLASSSETINVYFDAGLPEVSQPGHTWPTCELILIRRMVLCYFL